MLQQTQVERVVPRYLEWLARWPTVDSLASAAPADVIRAWQGLGYNRRALNLQRAARWIAGQGWPDDLTTLAGVGPYTAAAIRCFAFGEDVLPVDVNVARVQRRTRHGFAPSSAQALMDLGATVCLARVPDSRPPPIQAGEGIHHHVLGCLTVVHQQPGHPHQADVVLLEQHGHCAGAIPRQHLLLHLGLGQ